MLLPAAWACCGPKVNQKPQEAPLMLEKTVAELCARAEVPISLPVIHQRHSYGRNYWFDPDSHLQPHSRCHHHKGVVGHVLVRGLDFLPRALLLQGSYILLEIAHQHQELLVHTGVGDGCAGARRLGALLHCAARQWTLGLLLDLRVQLFVHGLDPTGQSHESIVGLSLYGRLFDPIGIVGVVHVQLLVAQCTMESKPHWVLCLRCSLLVDVADAHLLQLLHGFVPRQWGLEVGLEEVDQIRLLVALVHVDHPRPEGSLRLAAAQRKTLLLLQLEQPSAKLWNGPLRWWSFSQSQELLDVVLLGHALSGHGRSARGWTLPGRQLLLEAERPHACSPFGESPDLWGESWTHFHNPAQNQNQNHYQQTDKHHHMGFRHEPVQTPRLSKHLAPYFPGQALGK